MLNIITGFQEWKDGVVLCRNVSYTWASLNNDLITSPWITVRVITVGNIHFERSRVYVTVTGENHCLCSHELQIESSILWCLWHSSLSSVSIALRESLHACYIEIPPIPPDDSSWISTLKFFCSTSQQWFSSSGIHLSTFHQSTQQGIPRKQRGSYSSILTYVHQENHFSTWNLRHKCL